METKDTSHQLSEFLRILFHGRWIIVTAFLAVVGAVTFLTYRARPEYVSTASILILDRDRVETTLLNEKPEPILKSRNLNAIEILQSRRIAEDVIRALVESPYRNELELMRETDPDGQAGDVRSARDRTAREHRRESAEGHRRSEGQHDRALAL